jgi:hypothetical protein
VTTTDVIAKLERAVTYWDYEDRLTCTPVILSARERDLLLHVLKDASHTAIDWRGRIYRS